MRGALGRSSRRGGGRYVRHMTRPRRTCTAHGAFVWLVLACFGATLPACRSSPPGPEPTASAPSGSTDRDAPDVITPEPEAPSARAAPGAAQPDVPVVPVGDWGIEIAVPPEATAIHDAAANRHQVSFGRSVTVTLRRLAEPPPTREEAARSWNAGRDVERIDDGALSNGLRYAVRSQVVRVGVGGGDGRRRHRLREVGRVHAILPLDSGHVRCTGYVEHPVSPNAPDLERVKSVCLSMRLR